MAIKFKCSCGHVLSVPDSAAGKSGKCPKCQKGLRVPVPKTQPAAAKTQPAAAKTQPAAAKTSAKAAAPAASSNAGLDSLFEDAGLTERKGPACPQCGASIKPGARVCTQCGLNFETGEKLKGFNAKREEAEFDNLYLNEAALNMRRDVAMEQRREKSAMPWWVLMSFLIGAITLCLAGVVIVDGKFGTPAAETSFIGKVQRLPVLATLGTTALVTGSAILLFAHLDICVFAFMRSAGQGAACFFLPLLVSFPYGIMNWTDNKAPVKAIMMALAFIAFGVFLVIRAGGFGLLSGLF